MTLENIMTPICLFRIRRQLYVSNILGQGQMQCSDKTFVSLYTQTSSLKGQSFKGKVIDKRGPKALHFLTHISNENSRSLQLRTWNKRRGSSLKQKHHFLNTNAHNLTANDITSARWHFLPTFFVQLKEASLLSNQYSLI